MARSNLNLHSCLFVICFVVFFLSSLPAASGAHSDTSVLLENVLAAGHSKKLLNTLKCIEQARQAIIEETETKTDASPMPPLASGQESKLEETKIEKRTTAEYAVGKTVERTTILPGRILSLSVAVAIDLRNPAPDSDQYVLSVEEVEKMIVCALGLKPERDSIVVQNVRFLASAWR